MHNESKHSRIYACKHCVCAEEILLISISLMAKLWLEVTLGQNETVICFPL